VLSDWPTIVRIAARTGYPVKDARAGRDHGRMGTVRGVMRHHTGTGVNYRRLDDYPTLRVVQFGRPDLGGPLTTWGLGRSGCIYCVNDQVAWHAGAGYWRGTTDGNGHFWAIEAESDGTFWTPELIDCYPRLVASALHEIGAGWEAAPRHADYALPKGRKTDAAGMDEVAFEREVRAMLADPRTINRNYRPATAVPALPAPPAPEGVDQMYLLDVQKGTVLVVGTESYVLGKAQVEELTKQGLKHYSLRSPGLSAIGTAVLRNLRLYDGPVVVSDIPTAPSPAPTTGA
jgi:hypothetical protein